MQTLMQAIYRDVDLAVVDSKLSSNLLKHYNVNTHVPGSTVQPGPVGTANSPVSFLGVLLPLMMGCGGKSFDQLAKALNVNVSLIDKLYAQFSALHVEFASNSCLKSTNFMLSRDDIALNPQYLQAIGQYCAHSYFSPSDIYSVVSNVNAAVAANTNGLITDILKQDDVSAETFFVLLNTLYFKCAWSSTFDKTYTSARPFYGLLGQRNEQLMMQYDESFPYAETNDLQVLKMPYTDHNFSMCVVLPKVKPSRAVILDQKNLNELIKLMKYQDVNVVFPKFTQEIELDLIPFLQAHGVSQIFSDLEVPFMTDNTARKYVSLIKQKVKVVVNEDGTEATAATVAVCMLESCVTPEFEPINFVADHPFTYYIMYKDFVLFSGTYE